ncbi:uncharacterized protein C6orf136 homolog isoform X1 [Hippoglossus hippoglossus]|uniref:uncharacterized protein C6orf136 homolog isoform X1 n=1 Tax=Hippoglossus hippoglossus TaxID=8267 RepID=UPI00148E180D|nr:uncharacterized protein C6orf136 homolog isoform X1 [Hippoglossus hippoglossus]XP_034455482.1 uncharacterized protein C6orf136 homolog isoform X1 [Hippoglossus hippoglossus]
MAVSRGVVAFWMGCVGSHGRRQLIKKQSWTLNQAVNWFWIPQTCPLSSASWDLEPPNSLRYQNIKQPVLSHPFHNVSHLQREGYYEEDLEELLSVCVLVRQGESDGLHTLLEIPLFSHIKLGELLALGAHKSSEFSFPLTMVDGSREDDISMDSFKKESADAITREQGCFRSLFEAERCPAPFICGSHYYCFHCPGTEPVPCSELKSKRLGIGLDDKPVELPLLHLTTLCSHTERAEGGYTKGDTEEEEKLAVMYERLGIELPSFFIKNHDYTMYSKDIEFLNGLMNTKTRGRVLYQLILSLWRLLCLFYYADARLEVLKLTKHMEDRSIKARWRIRGLPFHSVLLRFYRKDKSHLYRSYDAFSTFYIGQDGLIQCHKVEKMMPAQPPVAPRITSLMAGALVALGVQEHRPALNLLPLLLSSLRHSRN